MYAHPDWWDLVGFQTRIPWCFIWFVSLGLFMGACPGASGSFFRLHMNSIQAGIAVLAIPLEGTWRLAAGWDGSYADSRYQSYPNTENDRALGDLRRVEVRMVAGSLLVSYFGFLACTYVQGFDVAFLAADLGFLDDLLLRAGRASLSRLEHILGKIKADGS